MSTYIHESDLSGDETFYDIGTVNQQILAARKFGVSQNKVIWRLFSGY